MKRRHVNSDESVCVFAVYLRVCVYACSTCTNTYTYINIWMRICMRVICIQIYAYIYMYTCKNICIYIDICMYTYVCERIVRSALSWGRRSRARERTRYQNLLKSFNSLNIFLSGVRALLIGVQTISKHWGENFLREHLLTRNICLSESFRFPLVLESSSLTFLFVKLSIVDVFCGSGASFFSLSLLFLVSSFSLARCSRPFSLTRSSYIIPSI